MWLFVKKKKTVILHAHTRVCEISVFYREFEFSISLLPFCVCILVKKKKIMQLFRFVFLLYAYVGVSTLRRHVAINLWMKKVNCFLAAIWKYVPSPPPSRREQQNKKKEENMRAGKGIHK